jgi:hypothetical protein
MNIAQIKEKVLGSETVALPLERMLPKDITREEFEKLPPEEKQAHYIPWLRYWDNEKRMAVIIHDDVLADIKTKDNLHVKEEVAEGPQGEYVLFTICQHKNNAEITL